jgi:transposase-like protein
MSRIVLAGRLILIVEGEAWIALDIARAFGQCILVIIGATPEGKKELIGFTDGTRESAHDWRTLLLDLKRRGLAIAPELAVADGALGFWKTLGEACPRRASNAAGCTRRPTS